jgi:hypothetical protein
MYILVDDAWSRGCMRCGMLRSESHARGDELKASTVFWCNASRIPAEFQQNSSRIPAEFQQNSSRIPWQALPSSMRTNDTGPVTLTMRLIGTLFFGGDL